MVSVSKYLVHDYQVTDTARGAIALFDIDKSPFTNYQSRKTRNDIPLVRFNLIYPSIPRTPIIFSTACSLFIRWVDRVMVGFSGASKGELMPVKSAIKPCRAFW